MAQMSQPGGYGDAGYRPGRPGVVTAAAIVLIVFGALGILGGLLGLLGGAFLAGVGGGGLFVILALVGLVLAVGALVAGIGIFGANRWAYNLGIWVSVAAIVVAILNTILASSLANDISAGSGGQAFGGFATAGGIVGIVIAVAIYGFVIWALRSGRSYFTR
ncbi:MAG: hypothetical protein M3295_07280 [Chloroflexota bacterium]|nr:hypothetical protein [Chloroflexota bacterium]